MPQQDTFMEYPQHNTLANKYDNYQHFLGGGGGGGGGGGRRLFWSFNGSNPDEAFTLWVTRTNAYMSVQKPNLGGLKTPFG